MTNYEVNLCELCGNEFHIDKYGEGACHVCGQKHLYDEGYMIVLSDKQKRILLENSDVSKL